MTVVAFPPTLPQNTVIGRLAIGPGPAEAIPISTLATPVVTGTVNFYVSPTGSDANTGLDPTVPFQHIQKAITTAAALLNPSQYIVYVYLANGNYTEDLIFVDYAGAAADGAMNLIGNTVTPTNVVIDGQHYFNSRSWTLTGIKFQCTAGGNIIQSDAGSWVRLQTPFEMGANVGNCHFYAHNTSTIYIGGTYTISGGAAFHFLCESGSLIRSREGPNLIKNNITFTNSFCYVDSGGQTQTDGWSYSLDVGASVTGKRFTASECGRIEVGGAGLFVFPGSVSGTIDTGGMYDNYTAPLSNIAGPASILAATYTVQQQDLCLIANFAGTVTLTLPSPSVAGQFGRILTVKTIQNQTVVSASGNVVPLAGGAAGTAILAGTAGKWAQLQCDGTNWIIMAAN